MRNGWVLDTKCLCQPRENSKSLSDNITNEYAETH